MPLLAIQCCCRTLWVVRRFSCYNLPDRLEINVRLVWFGQCRYHRLFGWYEHVSVVKVIFVWLQDECGPIRRLPDDV